MSNKIKKSISDSYLIISLKEKLYNCETDLNLSKYYDYRNILPNIFHQDEVKSEETIKLTEKEYDDIIDQLINPPNKSKFINKKKSD
jgi:hypothetical protein